MEEFIGGKYSIYKLVHYIGSDYGHRAGYQYDGQIFFGGLRPLEVTGSALNLDMLARDIRDGQIQQLKGRDIPSLPHRCGYQFSFTGGIFDFDMEFIREHPPLKRERLEKAEAETFVNYFHDIQRIPGSVGKVKH